MQRRDLLWVGLKLFGVLLLFVAVLQLNEALHAGMLWYAVGDATYIGMSTASGSPIHYPLALLTRNDFASKLTRLLFTSVTGLYLARGGKRLLTFMCGRDETATQVQPGPDKV